MTYDIARQRTVLFGGFLDTSVSVGDTWEWNGEFWTQVEDIGPAARGGHAMAYDAARGQTVLFGGVVGGAISSEAGDTWVWDGQAWTQVADTGPTPRRGAGMAYDSARERIVLFGGVAQGNNADTWEWDGVEWTQSADDGPPGREAPAMTYDNVRGRVVLFGGAQDALDFLNDTWEFDGVVWTRMGDTGPQPRARAAMVFAGTRTILFGGENILLKVELGTLKDTWEWSGRFWTQRQDIGPRDRGGHDLVYDSDRDRVVLFGGISQIPGPALGSVRLNDTWELPGNAITLTTLNVPSPLLTQGEGTVSLSGPSPIGGIVVALSSTGPIDIPASLIVAEGKTSTGFSAKPNLNGQTLPATATVTAQFGASRISKDVQIGKIL